MDLWIKLGTECPDEDQKEMLIAWLHFAGVDSVVEDESNVYAYCKKDQLMKILDVLGERVPKQSFDIEEFEDKNWNAEWEANFQAIDVGDIHVRAEFHPPSGKREIIISPKMAFGTGHHETSYMMIDHLSKMDLKGAVVLDYGCGTGILSIMASMQSADYIEAIDIQEEAIENTKEHFILNSVNAESVISMGDLEVLKCRSFDLILANINRHVLSKNSQALYGLLKTGGTLLVSGILLTDKEHIIKLYESEGFTLADSSVRGEWCLFVFKKIS